MPKLNKLRGAKKLPHKKVYYFPVEAHVMANAQVDAYNEAISEYENLEVEVDVEALTKLLWESNQKRLYGKGGITWERACQIDKGGMELEYYRKLAQEIINSMGKWIKKG